MNLLPSWQEAIANLDGTTGRVPGGPETPLSNVERERAIEALPDWSRERLWTLRERRDDAEAAVEGAIRQRNDLMERLDVARNRLKELKTPRASGGHGLGDAPSDVIDAQARVIHAAVEKHEVMH
jgi:hypothetical protein